jgi:hypothetical protein
MQPPWARLDPSDADHRRWAGLLLGASLQQLLDAGRRGGPVTCIPPTPDAYKLDDAVEVLGWLEAISPPDDAGHAGHFAWLCRQEAERQRANP